MESDHHLLQGNNTFGDNNSVANHPTFTNFHLLEDHSFSKLEDMRGPGGKCEFKKKSSDALQQ
jgi:hypothetical protein